MKKYLIPIIFSILVPLIVIGAAVVPWSRTGTAISPLYSADKVGIGTSTPAGVLSVSAINGATTNSNLFLSGINTIYASSSTSTIPALVNSFSLSTTTAKGNSPIFSVDGLNGLVGIGTANPSSPLHIVGNKRVTTGISIDNTNSTDATADQAYIVFGQDTANNNDGVLVKTGSNTFDNKDIVDNNNTVQLQANDGAAALLLVTSSTTAPIQFATGGIYLTNERMRIAGNGFIGIGTTTPNWPLQIASSSKILKGQLALTDSGAGANLKHWLFSSLGGNLYIGTTTDAYATSTLSILTLTNAGFLGIGSTNPLAPIHAYGPSAGLIIENPTAGSLPYIEIGTDVNNNKTGFWGYVASTSANTSIDNIPDSLFYANNDSGAGGLSFVAETATAPIRFATGGTAFTNERLRISANGRIGIGSTTPSGILTVSATAGATTNSNLFLSGINTVYASSSTSTIPSLVNAFSIATSTIAGQSVLSINGLTGNVGIGTSSPQWPLSIVGSTTVTGTLLLNGAGSNTNLSIASLGDPQNLGEFFSGTGTGGLITWDINQNNIMQLRRNSGVGLMLASNFGYQFTNGSFDATAATDSGIDRFGAGVVEVNNGTIGTLATLVANSVGVGTTSPYSLLSVGNTRTTAANTPLFTVASTTNGTATSTFMTILANGTVGLGTAAPTFFLDVVGTSASVLKISAPANSGGPILTFLPTNNADNGHIRIGRFGTKLQIDNNNGTTNLISIVENTGNTGIGTSTPQSILQLSGVTPSLFLSDTNVTPTTNGRHFFLNSNNGTFSVGTTTNLFNSTTTYLTLASTTNVGIGSTTPQAKLAIQNFANDSPAPLLMIASSTASATTTLYAIDNIGHSFASSSNPVISSCGTTPTLSGDDTHGTVTTGATAGGCTVTFQNVWRSPPVCTITPETGSVTNTFSYSISTTAITVTQTGIGGGKFDYICKGVQ